MSIDSFDFLLSELIFFFKEDTKLRESVSPEEQKNSTRESRKCNGIKNASDTFNSYPAHKIPLFFFFSRWRGQSRPLGDFRLKKINKKSPKNINCSDKYSKRIGSIALRHELENTPTEPSAATCTDQCSRSLQSRFTAYFLRYL